MFTANEFDIFTDAGADLAKQLIQRYALHVLPLTYKADGVEYAVDLSGSDEEFYKVHTLLRRKVAIHTKSPDKTVCANQFRASLQNGRDILFLGMSSALSNTFSSAEQALSLLKKEFPERKMFAVDTRAVSLGEGLTVLTAAKMRIEGATIEETRQYAEENKGRLKTIFTADDLRHLFLTGHVDKNGFPFAIENILKIRPILCVDGSGNIKLQNKVLGRKTAIQTLAKHLSDGITQPEKQTVAIAHGDCAADALLLKNRIIEWVPNIREILIGVTGPITAPHSGPGTLAVFFMGGDI